MIGRLPHRRRIESYQNTYPGTNETRLSTGTNINPDFLEQLPDAEDWQCEFLKWVANFAYR
jgi:hypothetical protein